MININRYIEYTNLKPTATQTDIINLCNEAIKHEYPIVCVAPNYVKLVSKTLKKTDIKICSVVGFPLGFNTIATKVNEAKQAIKHGATEIDMVINISKLLENDHKYIIKEINKVKSVCKNNILKVIVETAYLNNEQKIQAAKLVLKSKADFIKTSTGFAPTGASVHDVKIFKEILGNNKKIKASGGIKTLYDAEELINAGADRIGTSSKL